MLAEMGKAFPASLFPILDPLRPSPALLPHYQSYLLKCLFWFLKCSREKLSKTQRTLTGTASVLRGDH